MKFKIKQLPNGKFISLKIEKVFYVNTKERFFKDIETTTELRTTYEAINPMGSMSFIDIEEFDPKSLEASYQFDTVEEAQRTIIKWVKTKVEVTYRL